MRLAFTKPDSFGALASGICMVHCLATPFIFIAQTCSASCCDAAPAWWSWIDYFFLGVSFLAVLGSTRNSTNSLIKTALWMSWVALCFAIANERLEWEFLPKYVTYIVASTLIILHLYNLKFCQCESDTCCVEAVERRN